MIITDIFRRKNVFQLDRAQMLSRTHVQHTHIHTHMYIIN